MHIYIYSVSLKPTKLNQHVVGHTREEPSFVHMYIYTYVYTDRRLAWASAKQGPGRLARGFERDRAASGVPAFR